MRLDGSYKLLLLLYKLHISNYSTWVLMLNKIWYSQTHLNLINFLKGYADEITDTNPLENQIGLFYINGSIFRMQITSGRVFNLYVLAAFIFFLALHIITLPIYLSVYTWHLLINMKRVFDYTRDPTVLELQAPSIFKRYPNQWRELVYNMAYRRAVIAAFTTTYNLLKLIKSSGCKPVSIYGTLTLLLRLLLWLLLRFVWTFLFQVSWQATSRSYRFAMAFSGVRSYRNFRINIVRSRIINNFQSDDLIPGLYLRIYKTNKSVWNFNPDLSKYLLNKQALCLTENLAFITYFGYVIDQAELFVHNNHVTSSCVIGSIKGREIAILTNNTSSIRYDWPYSTLSYESHSPKKSLVQSITAPHLVQTDLLNKQTPNFGEGDFRAVLVETQLPSLLLVSNLLTRDWVLSNIWAHPQLTISSDLSECLNLTKQLYMSNPLLGKFPTDSDKLAYQIQILQHFKPVIFTNVCNFKLHKFPHDDDDFYGGFL